MASQSNKVLLRTAHFMAALLPVMLLLALMASVLTIRGGAPWADAGQQALPPVPAAHPRRNTAAIDPAIPLAAPASAATDTTTPETTATATAAAAAPVPPDQIKPPAKPKEQAKAEEPAKAQNDAASPAASASAPGTEAATSSLPPLPTRKPKPKPPTTPEGIFLAAMDKLIAPLDAIPVSEADTAAIKAALGAYKRSQLREAKTNRDKITDPAARKLIDWYALRVGFGRPEAYYEFLNDNPAWPQRDTLIKRAEEQLFVGGGSAQSIKTFFKTFAPKTGAGYAAMASAYLAEKNEPRAREFAARAWHELTLATTLETGFLKRFGKLLSVDDHRWRINRLLINNTRWRRTRRARAAKVRRLIALLPSKQEQQLVKARLSIYLRQRGAAKLLAAALKGPEAKPPKKVEKKAAKSAKNAAAKGKSAAKPTPKSAAAAATTSAAAQKAAQTAAKSSATTTAAPKSVKNSAAKNAKPPKAQTTQTKTSGKNEKLEKAAPGNLKTATAKTAPSDPKKNTVDNFSSDWGLQFQRVQLLRRQKKHAQAWKILLSAPNDAKKLVNPDAWWGVKENAIYDALRIGKIEIAAKLADKPGPISVNPRKDAAFMAGWIAFRHLKDYKKAAAQFQIMRETADGPLSASKAAFWLARALEKFDPDAARKSLADAASFNHTFHGQLAKQMLDPKATDLPIKTPTLPTSGQAERFNKLDAVKALVIARKSGLRLSIVRSFFYALRYSLREEADVLMLAHLARRLGDTQMSVRIGKTGVARKLNLYYYSYPTHALPLYNPLREPPEPAFLLGIARQETEFNPKLKSSAGARGILQIMPITARDVCRSYKIKCSLSQLILEPSFNTMIGSAYIGDRLREFKGSYVLTLSGYNAGPGRTRQWIRQFGDPRSRDIDVVDWVERIPFIETRKYVMKVLSNIQIYRARLGDQTTALQIRTDLARAKAGADK